MEEKMTAEEALTHIEAAITALGRHGWRIDSPNTDKHLAIIRTELTELRAERDKIKVSRDLHEQLLKEALDEASPYFQCGGRYAHWVSLGQCVFKGIGVLAEKYEAAQAELKAANETIEQERSLRSDVIAQRDAFREQNKVLKQAREEKLTGEAAYCAWHLIMGFMVETARLREAHVKGVTMTLLASGWGELEANGWRIVPVKIVKMQGE